MATTIEQPRSVTKKASDQPDQEVFRAIRDLGPQELFDFLEQVAYLLPEDLRYRLRKVVATAGGERDPLQRVLEIVRAQWEGLRADEPLRIAVVGPARSGKSSLIAALGEGNVERISRVFSLVDLQGLDEYLGYGSRTECPEDLAGADLILLVLDASRGFTEQTHQLVRRAVSFNRPLLLVLNKIDLVEKSRRVVGDARKAFGVPVVAVSVHRRESIRRLLRAIVTTYPNALYPLTQSLPGFRRGICRGIAIQAAFAAGLVGAIPIPVGDVLPVTAIQTAMLLKIARAHGFRINRERARELIPLFAGGLLVREGSRKLSERFPEKKTLISITVAGSWTYVVGLAAVSYFQGLNELAEKGRQTDWEMP